MWRCLTTPANAADVLPQAEAQQVLLQMRRQPPRWAVVVSSGGHFATAVFAMAPAPAERQAPKGEKLLFEVVAHKTFHRYVVRRVQMLECCEGLELPLRQQHPAASARTAAYPGIAKAALLHIPPEQRQEAGRPHRTQLASSPSPQARRSGATTRCSVC